MLATSNVGAELILDTPAAELNSERFNEALREELLTHFRPAFGKDDHGGLSGVG